jgi:hypothetical protein
LRGELDEGGSVAADAGVPSRTVVEILSPRVVGADLEAVGVRAAQVSDQRVIEADTLRDPTGGVGERGVSIGCAGGIEDGSVGELRGHGLVHILGEYLVIAVRADVAEGKRSVRRDLLLHAKAPANHGGRGNVGLHVAGGDFGAGGRSGAGRDVEAGDGDVREGLGCVEGRGLVETVIERIEQAVIEAEAGMNSG